jgi:DNA invertase Pin-like site-specific DNA recombinase
MKFGYARGSADDQDLAGQLGALEEAGCMVVFEDEESGVEIAFPSLDRCLAMLRPGDTLIVWRLDRLGRRLHGLAALFEEEEAGGKSGPDDH